MTDEKNKIRKISTSYLFNKSTNANDTNTKNQINKTIKKNKNNLKHNTQNNFHKNINEKKFYCSQKNLSSKIDVGNSKIIIDHYLIQKMEYIIYLILIEDYYAKI